MSQASPVAVRTAAVMSQATPVAARTAGEENHTRITPPSQKQRDSGQSSMRELVERRNSIGGNGNVARALLGIHTRMFCVDEGLRGRTR
jgi:hypothetical protein